jgi:hypothetical protein
MVSIGNISGPLFRIFDFFRLRELTRLARSLRDYADEVRRTEPNLFAFSRAQLAIRLGQSAHRIREVLEFMEERGWAAKVRYPADYWQVN